MLIAPAGAAAGSAGGGASLGALAKGGLALLGGAAARGASSGVEAGVSSQIGQRIAGSGGMPNYHGAAASVAATSRQAVAAASAKQNDKALAFQSEQAALDRANLVNLRRMDAARLEREYQLKMLRDTHLHNLLHPKNGNKDRAREIQTAAQNVVRRVPQIFDDAVGGGIPQIMRYLMPQLQNMTEVLRPDPGDYAPDMRVAP